MMTIKYILLMCALCFTLSECLTDSQVTYYRALVKRMFYHAYDGYMTHAYPYDELRPLTCDGHDTWGSYSLTLVDALSTLAVLDNVTEFQAVAERVLARPDGFHADINVSVFETNIRIVGGLISSHLLSKRMGMKLEDGWPCEGPLLRLAETVAKKLLPAFHTKTGMPYGTVNMQHGVPWGETPVTCTAGVGTFLLEFGALSRLTGDPVYEQAALRATLAAWRQRSSLDLLGNHIDVTTGRWTALDAGIGAGVDSYFEYLVKGAALLQRPELMMMFNTARAAIERHLRHEDWYLWVTMGRGHVTMPVFQSLEAFWPGLLTLAGDVESAQKTVFNYHQVWKQYGFTPESYNIPQGEAGNKREGYPLRPELAESLMYLYRATGDGTFQDMAADIATSIQHSARTPCGYATVKNVRYHELENRMESFFLAETTKYLHLVFSPRHWIHRSGGGGTFWTTARRSCVLDAGGYIFNSEAHPIDPGALDCCSASPAEEDGRWMGLNPHDLASLILDPEDMKLNFAHGHAHNTPRATEAGDKHQMEESLTEDKGALSEMEIKKSKETVHAQQRDGGKENEVDTLNQEKNLEKDLVKQEEIKGKQENKLDKQNGRKEEPEDLTVDFIMSILPDNEKNDMTENSNMPKKIDAPKEESGNIKDQVDAPVSKFYNKFNKQQQHDDGNNTIFDFKAKDQSVTLITKDGQVSFETTYETKDTSEEDDIDKIITSITRKIINLTLPAKSKNPKEKSQSSAIKRLKDNAYISKETSLRGMKESACSSKDSSMKPLKDDAYFSQEASMKRLKDVAYFSKESLVKRLKDASYFKESSVTLNLPRFGAISGAAVTGARENASGMEAAAFTPSVSNSKYAAAAPPPPPPLGRLSGLDIGAKIVREMLMPALEKNPRSIQPPGPGIREQLKIDLLEYRNFTASAPYSLLSCPQPSYANMLTFKGQIIQT